MILGKQISVLLITTVVLILGLIITSTPRTETIYKNSAELYPNIINELDKVSSIDINGKDKKLSFKKNNDGDWEIISNGSFPAQMNLVNDLLLGVADLKIIEQKTKDPKLYSLLQVDDLKNENSNAISMILKDPNDNILVNLLVGKKERQAIVGSKLEQLYVRKNGDLQSWLVEGFLPISLEFKDWVNQPLIPITANDIRKIIISNSYSKTPLVIYKENHAGDFYIKEGTDKKPNITAIQQNNSLVHMLSNMEYHHVTTYGEVSHHWQPNLKIEIDTIHDFKLKIELAKIKQRICARVLASFVGDKDAINSASGNKIDRVNEFSESWIFHISDDIYNLVNKPQKELVNLLKT